MAKLLQVRAFKIMILIFVLVLVGGYVRLFFTKGTVVYDEFFTRSSQGDVIRYQAPFLWENTFVEVKGDYPKDSKVEVTFHVDDGQVKSFDVYFLENNGVKILDSNQTVIYEGYYLPYESFYYLRTKDHEIDIGKIEFVIDNGTLLSVKELDPYLIISFATERSLEIRGNVIGFLGGIGLLVMTLLDFLYPRFFFDLKYGLSVANPEPSETYLAFQKLLWMVMPIVSVVILLVSICR